MRDDFLSRDWADGHRAFSASLTALVETIRVSLARLHTEQFYAPWKHERSARCG